MQKKDYQHATSYTGNQCINFLKREKKITCIVFEDLIL
jgi:hypothetical protein